MASLNKIHVKDSTGTLVEVADLGSSCCASLGYRGVSERLVEAIGDTKAAYFDISRQYKSPKDYLKEDKVPLVSHACIQAMIPGVRMVRLSTKTCNALGYYMTKEAGPYSKSRWAFRVEVPNILDVPLDYLVTVLRMLTEYDTFDDFEDYVRNLSGYTCDRHPVPFGFSKRDIDAIVKVLPEGARANLEVDTVSISSVAKAVAGDNLMLLRDGIVGAPRLPSISQGSDWEYHKDYLLFMGYIQVAYPAMNDNQIDDDCYYSTEGQYSLKYYDDETPMTMNSPLCPSRMQPNLSPEVILSYLSDTYDSRSYDYDEEPEDY